ncbi:MAG: fatty acid hydroxylase [Chthonomonadales bacterium]
MTYLACQLGAFFAWFLYGSFFEWAFHKYLFHSPKLLRATFEAHDQRHHGLYGGDETYDLPSPQDPGGKHIMMDWFALPLFLGFHLPLIWLVQWITGVPSLWGGLAAIAVYYLGYETLHFFMHVPRDRWIERTRVFRFLNHHHRLHHRDDATNLNVLFPLADLVLRTLRTKAPKPILAAAPRSGRVRAS